MEINSEFSIHIDNTEKCFEHTETLLGHIDAVFDKFDTLFDSCQIYELPIRKSEETYYICRQCVMDLHHYI